MLIKTLTQMVSSLAIGMVMLFSGIQLWWAIESLQQVRETGAAANTPAVSGISMIAEGWN